MSKIWSNYLEKYPLNKQKAFFSLFSNCSIFHPCFRYAYNLISYLVSALLKRKLWLLAACRVIRNINEIVSFLRTQSFVTFFCFILHTELNTMQNRESELNYPEKWGLQGGELTLVACGILQLTALTSWHQLLWQSWRMAAPTPEKHEITRGAWEQINSLSKKAVNVDQRNGFW